MNHSIIPIKLPFTQDVIDRLKEGDWVSLSGKLVTARDQAHARLVNALQNNQSIPLIPPYPALYYAGPTPRAPDKIIGACGPTTSARMDAFTPYLIEKGFKVSIGKGDRSEAVKKAIRNHHGLYLSAMGGLGAIYQSTVNACRCIGYPDLLSEALYELEVQNFLAVVTTVSSYTSPEMESRIFNRVRRV